MKNIYLVRHCEYSNPRNILVGRLPVELSEKGKDQAAQLAAFFQEHPVERIYSSAVRRCQQTSEIIATGNIPVTYDQRLLETLSAYSGYWFEPGQELDWTHFMSHRSELGGESYQDVQTRMVSIFKEATTASENDVILCSHGDPLHMLYLFLNHGQYDENVFDEFNDPEYQPKASIRTVRWSSESDYSIEPLVRF
jgi:2,3-bisphosphoglycerate-dependent phosphoglycerate mutase